MPFQPTEPINKIPSSIGLLKISFMRGFGEIISELQGDPSVLQEVALFDDLAVRDQDENIMDWDRGNLIPFLTPQEISGLRALMDRLWALAETEKLP